jgi:outer membrane receptor protein involved in Fe transport
VQALWRSATKADRLLTIEDTAFNKYPSYTLYNGTVGYRFTDNLRAQLAVMNLFDRDLPAAARTNLTFGQFDPLGRRYFLSLYATF